MYNKTNYTLSICVSPFIFSIHQFLNKDTFFMIFPVNGTDIILLKLQNESCTLTSPQLPKEQSDWLSVGKKNGVLSCQQQGVEILAEINCFQFLFHCGKMVWDCKQVHKTTQMWDKACTVQCPCSSLTSICCRVTEPPH